MSERRDTEVMRLLAVLACVASVGLLLTGWHLLGAPPRLLVDERGIHQRGLRRGWIGWDEIEGAYPPTLDDGEAVRLKLRRRGEVRIDLAGAGIGPLELMQEILARTASRQTPARPV